MSSLYHIALTVPSHLIATIVFRNTNMASDTKPPAEATFRDYVDLSSPRLKVLQNQNAIEHADGTIAKVPHLAQAVDSWLKLLDEKFIGITTDGERQMCKKPISKDF